MYKNCNFFFLNCTYFLCQVLIFLRWKHLNLRQFWISSHSQGPVWWHMPRIHLCCHHLSLLTLLETSSFSCGLPLRIHANLCHAPLVLPHRPLPGLAVCHKRAIIYTTKKLHVSLSTQASWRTDAIPELFA